MQGGEDSQICGGISYSQTIY